MITTEKSLFKKKIVELKVLTFKLKREDEFSFVLWIASAPAYLVYIVIIIRMCHYPSFRSLNWQVIRHNIVYSARPCPLSPHCGTVGRVHGGLSVWIPAKIDLYFNQVVTVPLQNSITGLNIACLWENLKKGMSHVTVGVACSIVMSATHVCLNFQTLSPAMVKSPNIEWKKTPQNKLSQKDLSLFDCW